MHIHVTPDSVRNWYDALLVSTLVEYRQAYSMLSYANPRNHSDLHTHLARALQILQQESDRRCLDVQPVRMAA